MFERFTDRARQVVVLAQEARMLNHDYIGTEHILLGLIHEGDGLAAVTCTSTPMASRPEPQDAQHPRTRKRRGSMNGCGTIGDQGQRPLVIASVSGLLRGSAHVRQARLPCLRCEVPRSFRTVHPLGWVSWKGKVIAPAEEELLSGIQG